MKYFNVKKCYFYHTNLCSNEGNTRNQLKFAGVPRTPKQISAVSGLKFSILWGHVEEILLFNKFFPIVDACLGCEDIARQSCAMVPRWWFLTIFCVLYFQRAARSTFQTCSLNSHYGYIMCGSTVDIQSAMAEIRWANCENVTVVVILVQFRDEKMARRSEQLQGWWVRNLAVMVRKRHKV